ncbi:AcrR family transcriptional regulator [Arthrobacter ulcerisalmonis]|uniref:TetR/AcrR family transcriptional regulator n=1 Tax=Arthrobacter sp. B1I2 TaxID=3042263 RepID=UPI002781D716|nr:MULTISPECIES: TetR family transcriptional regulator [Arthrobacter]MDQ0663285.1 AcrR family transcriptional regulator [Arthrobacter ulcerisalmonis]MDQ0731193.1 AcrR family transcriptional regulator [Arthrobacter sp. B1I2]
MARKSGEENRRNVLEVATRLFYQRGIRAVGMDTVVKECGVGNATIYRQFPTKDALATAYVQGRADAWFERMRQAAGECADPRDKLMAVFGVLAGDTAGATYRGCPMLNTSTEFPEGNHPAHLVAVAHKQQVRDWFTSLASDAGAQDPDELAQELLIVLNGAYATGAVLDGALYGKRALNLAGRLVDDACGRR